MKKALLIILLVSVLLFSGCIKLYINQKIHSNYDTDLEIIMDMSGMAGLMQGVDQNTSFADSCKQFEEQSEDSPNELADFKCEVDEENYIIKLSGTTSLEDTGTLEIERSFLTTKYKYDASKGKDYLDSLGDSDSTSTPSSIDFSQEMTEEQLQQMKAMGIEMVYTIEMPGTITKTDVGEIKDNKVVIDMMTLSGKENVYVESEEFNLAPIGMIIGIIVIGILLGIIMRNRA